MNEERAERVRQAVRASYAARASGHAEGCCGEGGDGGGCCGHGAGHEAAAGQAAASSCCGSGGCGGAEDHQAGGCCCGGAASHAEQVGYSLVEISSVPEGAEMSFGCGNPAALAGLQPGETVLDLGSGGGLDCLLAAHRVGPTGRVIGVDMTPEMIDRARGNARQGNYANVEFRLGEIEHLPVADATVDAIISNCVINLSPDKPSVLREAFRVLKPGGRLLVSDIVSMAPLSEEARSDEGLWCECLSGAEEVGALERMLRDAGFVDVLITPQDESREFVRSWAPGASVVDLVVSAIVEAWKP
ncbi:MAG: arsenite methyltransferase [Chloroflexi bacterium]|nr:arsenite methyltransferase [Chloroflexota bacterium]